MQNPFTRRRLALAGILLGTQLVTACCLPPIWHGGHGGRGGRHIDGPRGPEQPAPAPREQPRRPY